MNQNDSHKATWVFRILKGAFLALVLVIAYLFALNGRYMQVDDEYYFDKWTKSMLEITRYKTIE